MTMAAFTAATVSSGARTPTGPVSAPVPRWPATILVVQATSVAQVGGVGLTRSGGLTAVQSNRAGSTAEAPPPAPPPPAPPPPAPPPLTPPVPPPPMDVELVLVAGPSQAGVRRESAAAKKRAWRMLG